MDRKRKIGFVLFMVVFLAAAIVLPLLDQDTTAEESKPTAVLSDGRKIELHAVTYGTNHSVAFEQGPKSPWARLLPKLLHPALGGRTKHYTQSEHREALVPWLIVPPAPGSTVSPDLGHFSIVSDSGVSSSIGGRTTSGLDDGRRLVRSAIFAFPRRDEFFTLTGAVDRLPFSIRIKNPIFGHKFPTWTARALPATNHAGDYRFELAPPELRGSQHGGYLSAKLQIFHRDKPVKDWFATSFDLSDPTGNHSFILSTNEPIWKLHFRLRKTLRGPWPTNDHRELTLPDLPAATNHHRVPITDTINGFHFDHLWAGGPGRYRIENGTLALATELAPGDRETWGSQSGSHGWSINLARHEHWLMVETDRIPRDNHLLSIFVRDSKGKEVLVEQRGWTGVSGNSIGMFLLKTPWADRLAARKDPTKPTRLEELVTPPFTVRLGIQTNMLTDFIVDITKLKRAK